MVWGIQLFRLALRNNTVFYQLVKICKSRFSERPLLSDLWEWCITCNYFFCRMTNPWIFVYDKRRYHLCFGISYFLWHGKTVPCHRVELLWRILVRSIDTALWLIIVVFAYTCEYLTDNPTGNPFDDVLSGSGDSYSYSTAEDTCQAEILLRR